MIEPNSKKAMLPPLTGVRAFAALLVLLMHLDQTIPAGVSHVVTVVSRGYLGVDLFFLLSGFILTYVYFKSLQKPDPKRLVTFIWHRFIRLYPVHVTVLAGIAVFIIVTGPLWMNLRAPGESTGVALIRHILLVQAWGISDQIGWNLPSWSISAEWFAYLCFPALALCLARVRRDPVLILVAVISLLISGIIFHQFGWEISSAWIAPQALVRVGGSFVCGAALCTYSMRQNILARRSRASDISAGVALITFLIGASFSAPDFLLIAVLAVFILSLATSRGMTAKMFSLKPVIWLGEISYSLYMVHYPLLAAAHVVLGPRLQTMSMLSLMIVYMAAICISVGSAAMLYYMVERPARTRLRDLPDRLFEKSAPAST